MEDFRRELQAGEGKRIGRFDARFCADQQYLIGTGAFDPATDDAATAGVNSAHLSGFHQHLAADLGYRSDLHYRPLNNETSSRPRGTGGTRRPASTRRSRCRTWRWTWPPRCAATRRCVSTSWAASMDLATPFAGPESDIAHLYLGERLRRNVQFSWYEPANMTFVDEKVIPVMTGDLARFYAPGEDP